MYDYWDVRGMPLCRAPANEPVARGRVSAGPPGGIALLRRAESKMAEPAKTVGSEPDQRQCALRAEHARVVRLACGLAENSVKPRRAWTCGLGRIGQINGWLGDFGLWDFCGTLWCSVVLRRDNCNGRPAAGFKKILMKTKH